MDLGLRGKAAVVSGSTAGPTSLVAAFPRGRREACGELIGDGTGWRRAIYHHSSAANCMVLHPACHDDPISFYNLHGFYPDNLRRK
jgi:hypothetical protein